MFIQPLPFSEIIYLISIIFTWIYLIIGISGEIPAIKDAHQINVPGKELYSDVSLVTSFAKKFHIDKNQQENTTGLKSRFSPSIKIRIPDYYLFTISLLYAEYLIRRGPPDLYR